MAESQNPQSIIGKKVKRIEWGVAQSQPAGEENQLISKFMEKTEKTQTAQIPLRIAENVSALNFRNMPIKESEIIGPIMKQQLLDLQRNNISRDQNYLAAHESQGNKAVQKIKQLKNEFEILRGTIIDSKILEGQGERNYEKISNLSSSIGGRTINQPIKTGEAIRAKQKGTHINKMSSSSLSENGLSQENSQFKFKGHGNEKDHINAAKDNKREEILQKSKYSHKKSDNQSQIRREHSKASSRAPHQSGINKRPISSNKIFEKQSLEMKLASSLQKIQVLLSNEIVLKTKNKELSQKLKSYETESGKKRLSEDIERIEQLQNQLDRQTKSLEHYRRENLELVQVKAKLQAELIGSQSLVQMLKEEKNQYMSQAMTQKISYASLQIDNKRLEMQRNLQRKNLQYEIERLKVQIEYYKNNININNSNNNSNSNNSNNNINNNNNVNNTVVVKDPSLDQARQKIVLLEQELEDQERRHRKALEQAEKKSMVRDQGQLLQLIQKFHSRRKTQNQGGSQLTKQLAGLKEQLSKIKRQVDLSQSQFGFQSKVISLEEALKRDNQQKQKYLIQIEQFHKQYEDLKQKYRKCELQLEEEAERYLKATHKFKVDIEEADTIREKYEIVLKQNQQMRVKLTQLQTICKDHDGCENQLDQLKITFKRMEDAHSFEMKEAKRRNDLVEFEAFKKIEEIKMVQELEKRKLQSQISVVSAQLLAIQTELNYYRTSLLNQKSLNENLKIKVNQMEFSKEPRIMIEGHLKISQKQSIQREHEEQKIEMNKLFVAEQQKLMSKVVALTSINQQMSENMRNFTLLQVQNEELRQICKKKVSLESSILHLWDIKQIEYSNIFSTLKTLSSGSKDLASSQNIHNPDPNIKKTQKIGVVPQSIQVNSRIIRVPQQEYQKIPQSEPQQVGGLPHQESNIVCIK